MILTIELCCPPFPWFIGRKWKWRRSDSGLFRIQPSAPPPAGGFSKFIFVAENHRPSCPSSRSYRHPLQKWSKLPSAVILLAVFFRTRPWHHQQIEQQPKLPVRTRCRSSFIFDNGRSTMLEQRTWWQLAQNNVQRVFIYSSDRYKKVCQACFSTVGYLCTTWLKRNFLSAVG